MASCARNQTAPLNKLGREQNEEYILYCMLITSLVPFLETNEKETVIEWLKRLHRMGDTETNRITRNDYVWFLLVQLESGTLTLPFIKPPPKALRPVQDSVTRRLYLRIMATANKRQAANVDVPQIGEDEIMGRERPRCIPADFHKRQPSPRFGFVVYGSCFGNSDY